MTVLTEPETSTTTTTTTTNENTTTTTTITTTPLNHNNENRNNDHNEIKPTSSNLSNATNSAMINNPTPHRLPEGENATPLEVIGTTTSDKLVIIMVGLPATGMCILEKFLMFHHLCNILMPCDDESDF